MRVIELIKDYLPLLPQVPASVALAVVAVLGYFTGRWQRWKSSALESQALREIERAQVVAKELEKIATAIRCNLATHDTSVARFKERVNGLRQHEDDEAWAKLCKEAEEVLKPTLRLAKEIGHAYDEIRRQTTFLMSFTEVRTDPLTGVRNRRALDEALESMFAMKARYDQPFAIALFDIDHFKKVNDEHGHLCGDRVLRAVAGLLADTARSTDIVTRYGGEEFLVLMPQTDLAGAKLLSERLRAQIEDSVFAEVHVTVSAGIAEAKHGENAHLLLSRADEALYRAKRDGRNCVRLDEESEAADRELQPATAGEPPSDGEPLATLDDQPASLTQ